MKNKIDFSEVPYHYSLCLNHQCTKASTCLRQLSEQCAPETIEYWTIISPKHQSTIKGDCPYYRSSTKVRYAKGFMNIMENMPIKQSRKVISSLISTFSRRTYYRIRKGERPLSPDEQKEIIKILKFHGVAEPYEFDAFFEEYDW